MARQHVIREQAQAPLDQGLDLASAAERAPGSSAAEKASGSSATERAPGSEEILSWLRRRAAADRQMRRAADTRSVEPPPDRQVPDQPTLTDELTRQHNRIQYLTKQLPALLGDAGLASPVKVARRRAVADALLARIVDHDDAERQVLWPLVREVLPDGGTAEQQSARLGVPELARRLADLDPDTDLFDAVAELLITQVRRHDALTAELFGRVKDAAATDGGQA